MSPGVIQVRRDICHDCPSPCSPRPDAADPCAACPAARWGRWGACNGCSTKTTEEHKAEVAARLRGLGDLVAVIAEPIARALRIDKSKCGCGRRREWLNAAVPFGPARQAKS